MKKHRVTFGKARRDSYMGDVTTSIAVFLDGKLCGEITGEASDVSSSHWKREVRTTQYDVRLWIVVDGKRRATFDEEFDVDLDANDGKGDARSVLALAKDYAREHAGKPKPVSATEAKEAIEAALRALAPIVGPHRCTRALGGTFGPVGLGTRSARRDLRRALALCDEKIVAALEASKTKADSTKATV